LDPTQGGHTVPHHIQLAVGRDYGDVAPHRGLFFSHAAGDPPQVTVRVARMSRPQADVVHRGDAVQWQQQQQQQVVAARAQRYSAWTTAATGERALQRAGSIATARRCHTIPTAPRTARWRSRSRVLNTVAE
jgi:hypothetical protein